MTPKSGKNNQPRSEIKDSLTISDHVSNTIHVTVILFFFFSSFVITVTFHRKIHLLYCFRN